MQKRFNAAREFARRNAQKAGAIVLTVGTSMAHAASDIAAAETAIGATTTPINTIGFSVLVVLVAAATFKWMRRAL